MLPYKLTLCQLTNANVVLSGPWNLTDGDYSIVYSLSGSNSLVNQTMTISVRAGVASFQIPPLKFLTQERPTLQLAELLIWPQIVLIQRLCLNLLVKSPA
jgi:hypothetical protein